MRRRSSRPGLVLFAVSFPALKRWAITSRLLTGLRVTARSGGFGYGVLENDVDLVAYYGLGFGYDAGRKFEHGGGLNANGGEAPGFQSLLDVDYQVIAVEVDGVDGEAHGEGMNAVGGLDPKADAAGEARGIGSHEAAEARPVGAGDPEIGGEIGGAGAVEGVGFGTCRAHRVRGICDWQFVVCD